MKLLLVKELLHGTTVVTGDAFRGGNHACKTTVSFVVVFSALLQDMIRTELHRQK
jgi:hypothetical protein